MERNRAILLPKITYVIVQKVKDRLVLCQRIIIHVFDNILNRDIFNIAVIIRFVPCGVTVLLILLVFLVGRHKQLERAALHRWGGENGFWVVSSCARAE